MRLEDLICCLLTMALPSGLVYGLAFQRCVPLTGGDKLDIFSDITRESLPGADSLPSYYWFTMVCRSVPGGTGPIPTPGLCQRKWESYKWGLTGGGERRGRTGRREKTKGREKGERRGWMWSKAVREGETYRVERKSRGQGGKRRGAKKCRGRGNRRKLNFLLSEEGRGDDCIRDPSAVRGPGVLPRPPVLGAAVFLCVEFYVRPIPDRWTIRRLGIVYVDSPRFHAHRGRCSVGLSTKAEEEGKRGRTVQRKTAEANRRRGCQKSQTRAAVGRCRRGQT